MFDDESNIENTTMKITEVRVKLINGDPSRQRLRAFCSITFDGSFVVRDLKILEGAQGYFVAMPSRKLSFKCPRCGQKNTVASNFCCHCGMSLTRVDPYAELIAAAPNKLYVDVVHPVNAACREFVHKTIIDAYLREVARSREPGYVSSYDDFYDA